MWSTLGNWEKRDVKELKPDNPRAVRLRATALPAEGAKLLERALDLEDMSISPEQREKLILEYIQKEVLPFMEVAGTVEGASAALAGGKMSRAMVHKRARELLATKAKTNPSRNG
jgi:hypothetical protein